MSRSIGPLIFPEVALQIRGDQVPFDEITRTLQLTPTRTVHKGGIGPIFDVPVPEDAWIYELKANDEKSIDDCLIGLWQALHPNADYLRQLRLKYRVSVSCSFMTRRLQSQTVIGGLVVGHDALRLFTELEMPLRITMTQFDVPDEPSAIR